MISDRTEKAGDVQAFLHYRQHCNGFDDSYKHPIGKMRYSDGLRVLATVAEAFWLIDLIAAWQLEIGKGVDRDFQVWWLEKLSPDAFSRSPDAPTHRITCWTDTPGDSEQICKQDIPYSDFPEELLPLKLWVNNGMLMLPEEY